MDRGALVSRMVDSSDLVGVSEIAARYGVTRACVVNWGVRHAEFPRPVVRLAMGPVYLMDEVSAWWHANPAYGGRRPQ